MNAPIRPSLPRGLNVLCDDTVRPGLPLREKAAGLLAGGARVAGAAHGRLGPVFGAVASDVLLAEDIAERVGCLAAAFDRGSQGTSLVGGDV
jgi:hypothetical protein